MTTNFYAPPDHIRGSRITLPEDEARHASRVLRAAVGDEIIVVDGAAGWYRVEIDHIDRLSVEGHIVERRREVGEPPYELVLGFGLIKNRGRMETLLEKSVELGASVLAPLVTARTERERIREERLESKLISAMKQCGRSRLPELLEPVALADFLNAHSDGRRPDDLLLICHEAAPAGRHLLAAIRANPDPRRVVVTVGPEGGFSDEEVEHALRAGFEAVSLGCRRLRAETAGIAAAAALMLACEIEGAPPRHAD